MNSITRKHIKELLHKYQMATRHRAKEKAEKRKSPLFGVFGNTLTPGELKAMVKIKTLERELYHYIPENFIEQLKNEE